MENWGLVTYRTTAVLFDEGKSDTQFKNRIAYVVAHGMDHLAPKQLFIFCFDEFALTVAIADIRALRVLQNWLTNGSGTWSRWTGGMNSGSMRVSPPGWAGPPSINSSLVSLMISSFDLRDHYIDCNHLFRRMGCLVPVFGMVVVVEICPPNGVLEFTVVLGPRISNRFRTRLAEGFAPDRGASTKRPRGRPDLRCHQLPKGQFRHPHAEQPSWPRGFHPRGFQLPESQCVS
jgi:hypothetical protein